MQLIRDILAFFVCISLIAIVAVCNDDATVTQIIMTAVIGSAVIFSSVILMSFSYKERFILDFYDDKGRRRTTRPVTIIGKAVALYVAKKCGYHFYQETMSWDD